MHAALGLCLRHALHAVHAAFELHTAVCARPFHGKTHFLHAAQLGDVCADKLSLPALRLGVHAVHTVQAVGKQRRFFAARAAAYFHDDIFIVIFILRQKQQLYLFPLRLHRKKPC